MRRFLRCLVRLTLVSPSPLASSLPIRRPPYTGQFPAHPSPPFPSASTLPTRLLPTRPRGRPGPGRRGGDGGAGGLPAPGAPQHKGAHPGESLRFCSSSTGGTGLLGMLYCHDELKGCQGPEQGGGLSGRGPSKPCVHPADALRDFRFCGTPGPPPPFLAAWRVGECRTGGPVRLIRTCWQGWGHPHTDTGLDPTRLRAARRTHRAPPPRTRWTVTCLRRRPGLFPRLPPPWSLCAPTWVRCSRRRRW